VGTILDIVMVAGLCDAVIRLGRTLGDAQLEQHATDRRRFYIAAGPVILVLALVLPLLGLVVALPLVVALAVLMYRLMREAQTAAPRLSMPPTDAGPEAPSRP
jgi:hypothetical protein